jgi:hypothetical protein
MKITMLVALFHFLTSSPHIRKIMLKINVSFFNELATEKKKLCSIPLFHFLTILPERSKTMLKTSISFFNELATEKQNYAQNLCFIF